MLLEVSNKLVLLVRGDSFLEFAITCIKCLRSQKVKLSFFHFKIVEASGDSRVIKLIICSRL